jgi:hypothetical protein
VHIPNIELCGNPSVFNAYAQIRQSVLERCMKEAARVYHQSTGQLTDSESEEEGDERSKEVPVKIPKVTKCVQGLICTCTYSGIVKFVYVYILFCFSAIVRCHLI